MSDARPLYEIAAEIRQNWINVHWAAVPYLEAMETLDKISDSYGAESATSIVLYFRNNAGSWRGEVAKRIKNELKSMTEGK